ELPLLSQNQPAHLRFYPEQLRASFTTRHRHSKDPDSSPSHLEGATASPRPPTLNFTALHAIDTSVTRNFVHSPVVKVGNVSEQAVSSTGSGKNGSEPPLRLWLCPSLEPISPTKTQDT
ncbi:hypothetical protein M9458_018856, partial [Cirrhinus mrigala]